MLSFYNAEVNFTAVEMDKTGNDFGTGDWVSPKTLQKLFLYGILSIKIVF